jgi:hypothetical protein
MLNRLSTLPRPRPLATGGTKRGPISRFLVLEASPNPTSNIYLRPRLPVGRTRFVDLASRPQEAVGTLEKGTFVILCRYVNSKWMRFLEQSRDNLAGVALFLDDDIAACIADTDLPVRYRVRLWRQFGRWTGPLSRILTELWVSTELLADRYRACNPKVLGPLYIRMPPGAGDRPPFIVFYHGSGVHLPEIRWLATVMEAVMRDHANVFFQLFGNRQVRNVVDHLPRTTVLHPVRWPDFLALGTSSRLDLGLAPLLSSEVNAARAPVKFFDITRCGAPGIYSEAEPYSRFVRHGVDGLLLPNLRSAWVDAIVDLMANPALRNRLRTAAAARLAAMRGEGETMWQAGLDLE